MPQFKRKTKKKKFDVAGFLDLSNNEFLIWDICAIAGVDSNLLHRIYIPRWSVTNGSRLDDPTECHGMVDKFSPPMFFALVHGMDHDQLFLEFNVGSAHQTCLGTEVRMRAEYNIKEDIIC